MRLLEQIQTLSFPAPLPPTLLEVEQHFDAPRVDDIAAAVRSALTDSGILAAMRPGASVAVGVGSRGIANLPVIVAAVVNTLRANQFKPYVVPAMGSHGGATAEGQIEVLAALGITPESMGVEVIASMDVVEIAQLHDGPSLYQGVDSRAADHTLLVSRIKPHTDFRSHVESGPAKMSVIGLGKQTGAIAMHIGGVDNFKRYLAPAAPLYAANTNLVGALCIVENAYDETAIIDALSAKEIGGPREEALLVRAKALMASLPLATMDVLVMREIGKNISGTGMDTNVTGRLMIPRQPETFGNTDIAIIAVLDLTPETHGHATGIGMANITTARVVEQIDWDSTYTNAISASIFGMWRHHLPIVMADDRRALEVAVRCCGRPAEDAQIVLISNTLHLERVWVSPNLRAQIEAHPRLRIVGETALTFAENGAMLSPWTL